MTSENSKASEESAVPQNMGWWWASLAIGVASPVAAIVAMAFLWKYGRTTASTAAATIAAFLAGGALWCRSKARDVTPYSPTKCDLADEWNLSDEREFMENLVQQRFNFLIAAFGLIVAGAMSTERDQNFIATLGIGALLCTLVSLPIYRAHIKLDVILRMLHGCDSHPVNSVGREAKSLGLASIVPMTWVIGMIVPLMCTGALVVGFGMAVDGHLKAKDDSQPADVVTRPEFKALENEVAQLKASLARKP